LSYRNRPNKKKDGFAAGCAAGAMRIAWRLLELVALA